MLQMLLLSSLQPLSLEIDQPSNQTGLQMAQTLFFLKRLST